MIDTADKVFSVCKHYDDIINYDIASFDEISYDLIDWYKDFVFSRNTNSEDDIIMMELLDKCMYYYINDYKYQKGLKKIINIDDIDLNSNRKVRKLIKTIFNYHQKYEEDAILNIYVGKWI